MACPVDVKEWWKSARVKLTPGQRYHFVFWVQRELGHNADQLTSDVTRLIERFAPGADVSDVRALKEYTPRSSALHREDLPGRTLPTVDGPAAAVEATVDYRGTDESIPWITHSGTTLMAGTYGNSCPVGAEYVLQEVHREGDAPAPEPGIIDRAKAAVTEVQETAKAGAGLAGFLAVALGLAWLATKARKAKPT